MRLKRIKLAGFKSFVDPTNIPFPDDMTAIVGPNGCGKSNVIDAVRWVLGESSAKNLRGDAMTDVIFNGSSARKPVSQCSVELVFDNSSGRIQGEFANYNELSVKRVVTRDAQSLYYLNSAKCRRRDVTDLFLGTGLGPRSYAIIEQGMISRLIESKPQELRVFIEEAAGISKYKERRRETENRIRHTKDNLERLEDVRGELGKQLEKLQRQAAAAKRYKELKAKERTYKGELAAVRWLKHTQHVEQLSLKEQQQNAELEAFVAQQRGDEKGITEYREKQQDLKQTLEDIQQQYFSLGTEITRLEQNQLHAKQRRQQIDQERRALEDQLQDLAIQSQQEQEQLEELQAQLEVAEPEQAMLDEQLEQYQERLLDAEDGLSKHEADWRAQEGEFNQLKQQAQAKHSQIQSTMNMQMRTQQRIGELEEEQRELEQDLLAQQVESLESEVAKTKGQLSFAQQQASQAEMANDEAHKARTDAQQHVMTSQGELQRLRANIEALNTVIQSAEQDADLKGFLTDNGASSQLLGQYLHADSGWEPVFELICQHWSGALVAEGANLAGLWAKDHQGQVFELARMTTEKRPGTLGEKLNNAQIPHLFNSVWVATDTSEAISIREQLAPGESIVTSDGLWVGQDWQVAGANDPSQGMLARAAQLRTFEAQLTEAEAEHTRLEATGLRTEEEATATHQRWQQRQNDLKQAEHAHTQQQNQLNLLSMQHQQSLSRQTRISEELSRQHQTLEDEKLQMEELAMQVEELELTIADRQEQQQFMESQREQRIASVESSRGALEQIKSQVHQMALTLQALQSQHKNLTEGQHRSHNQKLALDQRFEQLNEEYQLLGMPLEEQAEKLHELLEKRQETSLTQTELADQLAEVERFLADAEKGQVGVREKIARMQEAISSTKLEIEGYRVRANSVLEQVQETGQSLKPILESLSDEADEEIWQQELDKTQAAVSRLGAVNLAAVEEFDIQSERKRHLDEQNDDLIAALDTLESAIRKIDKETRSRFSDTFERVNDDLKSLFPKVFGGGSAYLALTDDDLLETGVTIMARPPGKKNSTIHLLSGGEKALTALSLVFAIFRLNPAPFCLLDEVDAPLDDANVGRFCKLVSEMSKTVQFIYITHNKIAMEMATHLTGVTMAEPGVSRMVAVDVEEAVAIAQA